MSFQGNSVQNNALQSLNSSTLGIGVLAGTASLVLDTWQAYLKNANGRGTGVVLQNAAYSVQSRPDGWVQQVSRRKPHATASNALVGSTAISIGASAALSGLQQLSGSGALAFGASASLPGVAALSGLSEMFIQRTYTPTLGAVSPISGSAAVAFSNVSTLTNIGPRGILIRLDSWRFKDGYGRYPGTALNPWWYDQRARSAIAALTTSASATLIGTGAAASTTPMAMAASAPATAIGVLAGSAALALSGKIGDPGATNGTASLAIGATMLNGQAMTGTASMSLSGGTSTLTGTGSLSGSMTMVIGMGGYPVNGVIQRAILQSLSRRGYRVYGAQASAYLNPYTTRATSMVGIVPMTTAATGALIGTGNLVANEPITFNATGTVDGALAASASMSFVANGLPRADGALVANEQIRINGNAQASLSTADNAPSSLDGVSQYPVHFDAVLPIVARASLTLDGVWKTIVWDAAA